MEYIQRAARKIEAGLPNIRPLSEFLHLNMLPGLQDKNFWDALHLATNLYSFLPFLPISFYHEKFQAGEIDNSILQGEIARQVADPVQRDLIRDKLFRKCAEVHLPEKSYRPLHKILSETVDQSLNELTEPILIRVLSSFYDQGYGRWSFPKADQGLLSCFFNLILNSYLPFYPVAKDLVHQLRDMSAEQVIDHLLSMLMEEEQLKELFLEECALSLKGWSGLVKTLTHQPQLLLEQRKCTTADMLAVRLVIEVSWLKALKYHFRKISLKDYEQNTLRKTEMFDADTWRVFMIWHEAYERSYHFKILNRFRSMAIPPAVAATPQVQALFCIDDRECSLRRFLERSDSSLETFGTPGHFGLAFFYKAGKFAPLRKQCPAPLNPKHVILSEAPVAKPKGALAGFVDSTMAGLKLLRQVFLPAPKQLKLSPIVETKNAFDLKFYRLSDQEQIQEMFSGYTLEEAAQVLEQVFTSIGMKQFAPLVFIIGHGSTTTNNPYYTAYGCGACSGRTGNINAIAFCEYANNPQVRKLLREQHQLQIPEGSYFVPGFHDTCQDTITFYDVQNIPLEKKAEYLRFKRLAESGLKKNAHLRCRDFELVPKDIKESEAFKVTINRSQSIFEPRPELGHTRNSLCLVTRRALTREFSFDRRAFLQSYDYRTDPDGKILTGILGAAIPVCGGINLDYWFSRMNNKGIGAGSKLAHNVVGLVALSNGTEDDLLTGLAMQMVELHEPIRVLMVIEQHRETMEKVLNDHPGLKVWVENEWVRFALEDPRDGSIYYWDQGGFKNFEQELLC